MKSDIEIARETKLTEIHKVATNYGIPADEIENYGSILPKLR